MLKPSPFFWPSTKEKSNSLASVDWHRWSWTTSIEHRGVSEAPRCARLCWTLQHGVVVTVSFVPWWQLGQIPLREKLICRFGRNSHGLVQHGWPGQLFAYENMCQKMPHVFVVPEDATCVCGKKALAFFSPCSHVCCASCPWRQFQNFNFGRLPELICPRCNLTFEDHTMEFLAQRRGIIRCDRAPPWISQSNCQSCHSCGCVNAAQATQCINCGWTPSEPRVGWKVGWKSWKFWKFSCFDWLRPSRPGHLATRFAPLRPSWDPWLRQRKVQSLERWKELPEDLEEPRFRDVGGNLRWQFCRGMCSLATIFPIFLKRKVWRSHQRWSCLRSWFRS